MNPRRHIMSIMVDTHYDTESFRARLFNVIPVKPNQATLRILRAALTRELDPDKWTQMKTNRTMPFDLPRRESK